MTFNTAETASITRTTLRQLQWMDQHGLVKPVVEGHKRQYTQEQVLMIAVLSEFKQRRLYRTIRGAQPLIRFLARHAEDWLISGRKEYLVVCEGKLSLEVDERKIVNKFSKSFEPCYLVDVFSIVSRIET